METLARATWVCNTYTMPPRMRQVADIPITYFAHAPEIRRKAARTKRTFTFAETHSWLEVGLQVLKRAGWWPECSQPHSINIERAVPPDEFVALFFQGRTYEATERIVDFRGERVPTSLIKVLSSAVRIDSAIMTQ